MTLTWREAEESKEMEEGLRVHANALLSLSSSSTTTGSSSRKAATAADGVFECKTCSKRFPSFQALGGHRTSHTRLQAKILDDDPPAAEERGRAARVHECTVCGLEFSMGQALGGHMRRHRGEAPPLAVTDGAAARPDQEAMPDLNFPPLEDDGGFHGQERSGGDQNSSEPQLLNLLV